MDVSRIEIIEFLKEIYPFRKNADSLIEFAAENVEPVQYRAGDVIFTQGQPAKNLFILMEGRVRLTQLKGKDETEVFSDLSLGNIFGYEMISEQQVRLLTATATTDVILLRIDQSRLVHLVNQNPELGESFQLLYDSFRLNLKVRLNWLGENEALYFIARRHPMFLFVRLLPIGLFALVTFVPLLLFFLALAEGLVFLLILLVIDFLVIAGWTTWAIVDWANDYAIVTNKRALFLERVLLLYDSRQESPLTSIMAVSTESDQIGRLFSYGNVVIHTYAGLIVLPSLKSCNQIVKIVEAECNLSRSRMSKTERVEMEHTIRSRLGLDGDRGVTGVEGEKKEETKAKEPGALHMIIASLFQIRFEKGGTITYRTHWFMLIKRIWLPTLILLGMGLLLLANLAGVFTLISPAAMLTAVFFVGLFVFIWWLYQYVDWRNDFYMVTDEQVLDVYKKPLGREERRAAPLRNIQSITFERLGVIGLLLNFGVVYIKVGDTTLTFDFVSNPAEVQRDLFNRIAQRDHREKQAEWSAQQQSMAEWLQTYHRVIEESGSEQHLPPMPPGFWET